MPELPEVETTRRGIEPHILGKRITQLVLRRPDLRWPIPDTLAAAIQGEVVQGVRRRAKYLLLDFAPGSALLHLGMSGSLRVLPADVPVRAHDHVDFLLEDQHVVRFNDPRRFGALLWQPAGTTHTLLADLGPEPLSEAFNGAWLYARSRGRKAGVKTFLMDQANVVGVGNIYAAEALFAAGISPLRAAGAISRARYERLAEEVKRILAAAILRGGTTLRDFISPDGSAGYFAQELSVYGREGETCLRCGTPLRHARIGQRASVWCPNCQK